jgi:inhibitor of KinA
VELRPLGDQAILASCDDEPAAARLAAAVRAARPAWVVDVVPAYASVAVFFDALQTRHADAAAWLAAIETRGPMTVTGRSFVIPCCYELGPDLDRVAGHTGLTTDEVVRRHTETEYTVFAVGFCPGFPYLGYLPPELSGVPRLDQPRLRVEPGSVGLTGRQTGVYPLPRPGGWNLIGRTPLELVHLADGYFAFAPGDRVRFAAIGGDEWSRRLGQRPGAGESRHIAGDAPDGLLG